MNKLKPRIVIEKPLVRDQIHIHVNTLISSTKIVVVEFPLSNESEYIILQTGPIGSNLVRRLLRVQGVVDLVLRPYSVSISKGPAFEWPEIMSDIEDALKSCFPDTKEEIEIKKS